MTAEIRGCRRASPFDKGNVRAVAVDPKNKCTVYATLANEIYKTETCGRDWGPRLLRCPREEEFHRARRRLVQSDPRLRRHGRGRHFPLQDAGISWQAVKRVQDMPVTGIVIHPGLDSRASSMPALKATASGRPWTAARPGPPSKTQLRDEEFPDARKVVQLVIDPVQPGRSTTFQAWHHQIDGRRNWAALPPKARPRPSALRPWRWTQEQPESRLHRPDHAPVHLGRRRDLDPGQLLTSKQGSAIPHRRRGFQGPLPRYAHPGEEQRILEKARWGCFIRRGNEAPASGSSSSSMRGVPCTWRFRGRAGGILR